MSNYRGSIKIPKLFAQGKAGASGVNQSTGQELYYQGNLIAQWRKNGLWISNGGFVPENGATGSQTTKTKLNALPKVDIQQRNYKWYLNGAEWDGSWKRIKGTKKPKSINRGRSGGYYVMGSRWRSSDAWIGQDEPVYAVVGANDTGTWSDSPCRTEVCDKELEDIRQMLLKHGIPTKEKACQTSNLFCISRYLIPQLKNVEKARKIVADYLLTNETRLLYIVELPK